MLAILLSYVHNIFNFIILLFFPQQFIVVHHSLHTPSASDRPRLFLWPSYLWTSCCLCYPDSSVGFLLSLLEKNFFFFLTEISASFLFELAHSLLITIDYFWLLFLLICEMYAPELNAVLYKSIYQSQKDYPYICLFFFKILSLFWAMVWFDLLFQIVCVWGREEWLNFDTI